MAVKRPDVVANSDYAAILLWIQEDLRKDRFAVHRRIFMILLWCLILPAIIASLLMVGIRLGWLPADWKRFLDWVTVMFPAGFALYVFVTEVATGFPAWIRVGGLGGVLKQIQQESEWRASARERVAAKFKLSPSAWLVVAKRYEADLKQVQFRTNFLVGLGSAVFFILLQGLDLASETDPRPLAVEGPKLLIHLVTLWNETFTRITSLGIFSVLLYLSGVQMVATLRRYIGVLSELAERDS